jgi:site-specific recombinase XerD
MKWDYWLCLFLQRHCTARGLSPRTIAAYDATLRGFRCYVQFRLHDRMPDALTARDVLEYVDYLRQERGNGPAAVNRQVTVLKSFYRAIVAMGHLEPGDNPMAHFPRIKGIPRKLPGVLSREEVKRILEAPQTNTIIGLRDRALLMLLYGTGIRATECATLREADVDLEEATIRVVGKGGHERVLPLNRDVVRALKQYRQARGPVSRGEAFLRSRHGGAMGRGAVYERVRTNARRGGIQKRVSPHRLRHTFATHLVQAGVKLVTIRDLLGHRWITSTQVYLHTTAEDLRHAAEKHPIEGLVTRVEDLLPNVKLPFQFRTVQRRASGGT